MSKNIPPSPLGEGPGVGARPKNNAATLSPNPLLTLLPLLVCPLTRGPLSWCPEHNLLISQAASRAYRVENGVPILLIDESIPWPAPVAG